MHSAELRREIHLLASRFAVRLKKPVEDGGIGTMPATKIVEESVTGLVERSGEAILDHEDELYSFVRKEFLQEPYETPVFGERKSLDFSSLIEKK